MEQYISKSALVAEIERRTAEISNICKGYIADRRMQAEYNLLFDMLSFINTLEGKEVDLDSDIRIYLTNHFNIYEDGVLQSKKSGLPLSTYDIIKVAKHFFELGLRVNNPITAADKGIAEEIIINLKRVEQDYHIDLTKEMEWLRKKTRKGE